MLSTEGQIKINYNNSFPQDKIQNRTTGSPYFTSSDLPFMYCMYVYVCRLEKKEKHNTICFSSNKVQPGQSVRLKVFK